MRSKFNRITKYGRKRKILKALALNEDLLEAYIIDDKKLVIALSDLKSDSEEYSFAIWHNSPIIEPLKQHFERNWGKRVD